MTPGEKRSTWRRITMDGTAWRFNRYAERAREARLSTSAVDPVPNPASDSSAQMPRKVGV